MKKIVSAVCAVAALAASFALFSCQGATSYSSAIDTVYNLDGPGNLTAKAYPGTNIITWSTVKDANGYEIYRDNAYLGFVDESETCVYPDSDILEDGKTYKYTVVSTSKSNASRTAYANNGKSTVNCKAIVPAVGTAALDLAAKEDGYDKNAAVLSADTITATVVDGSVYVTFPAKPYLTYTVYTSADNQIAAVGGLGMLNGSSPDEKTTTATTAYATVAITDSGKKTITVAASSANKIYAKSTVTATATVTVPKLFVTTNTSNVNAVWASATKAHITFTGAKLDDGTYAPASYYKVYRYADLAYTEVTGVTASTTKTSSTAVAYYVDDASAPAAGCTYYVAITNGTNYGTSVPATLAAYATEAPAINPNVSKVALDADGIENDIELKVTVPNDETAAISYADSGTKTNANLVAADFTNAVTLPASYEPTATGKTYTIFIKDLTVDHYYYFRTVASKTGYTDAATCTDAIQILNSTLSGAALVDASTYALPTSTTANNISVLVTDSASNTTETFANYSYELFRSEAKKSANKTVSWTEWTSLGAITLTATVRQPSTTSTSYEYVYTATGVADGIYAYMVVKTDSASKTSTVSNTSTVAITTTADAKAAKSTLSDIYTAGASRSAETSGTVMFYVNTTNAAGYTFTLYRAPVAANGSSQMDEYSVCSLTAAATAGQPDSACTLYTYTDNSVVKNTAYNYYLKATKPDATDIYSSNQPLASN